MGLVLELLFEIVFQIIFEVIVRGSYFLVSQAWFRITGQRGKAQDSMKRHRMAKDARRKNIERIRLKRRQKA